MKNKNNDNKQTSNCEICLFCWSIVGTITDKSFWIVKDALTWKNDVEKHMSGITLSRSRGEGVSNLASSGVKDNCISCDACEWSPSVKGKFRAHSHISNWSVGCIFRRSWFCTAKTLTSKYLSMSIIYYCCCLLPLLLFVVVMMVVVLLMLLLPGYFKVKSQRSPFDLQIQVILSHRADCHRAEFESCR